jgi:hypothetical protein
MGQTLTAEEINLCRAIANESKVAIKGGHGVGKTYPIGTVIVPWFLHSFDPAIIVTTAPSGEQVKNEIWRYIRRGVSMATMPLLRGMMPKEPFWDVADLRYAQGRATDQAGAFKGKHCENMLFIFDEANAVEVKFWEEAEYMLSGGNNKWVVIDNPTDPSGPFADCFKPKSGWYCITVSCLDHPNVLTGRNIYPGAVTRDKVIDGINKHCVKIEQGDERQANDFEFPQGSGQWYRPNNHFLARRMGIFPDEGPDTLIPLRFIEAARHRHLLIDPTAPVDLGCDVAYSGPDYSVIYARRGPCVIKRWAWQGVDPERYKIKLAAIIKDLADSGMHVGTVAIDAIGIGSGVAHGLIAMQNDGVIRCDRIVPVQVSERAYDPEKFANRRAELAHGLAARFRAGEIDLSRLGEDAAEFESQTGGINRIRERQRLRELIESKDDIRKRLKRSPDDFDAMVLCFLDTVDFFVDSYAALCSSD